MADGAGRPDGGDSREQSEEVKPSRPLGPAQGRQYHGTVAEVGRSRVSRLVAGMALLLTISACTDGATTHSSAPPPSTAAATTSTTAASSSAAVLPVGACSRTFGGPSTGPAWVPTQLAGAIPPTAALHLEFYSIGTETLLGPRGWSCAQLTGADGSAAMDVYPRGQPNPTTGDAEPAVGSQIISATFDYTGHVPGVDLACPYFPREASSEEPCPRSAPTGELVHQLTPDVVTITDPAGIKGALAGSGGPITVTGEMIVPQAPNLPDGVSIAEESCSLADSALCPSILQDFLVRQFPVPTHPPSSS